MCIQEKLCQRKSIKTFRRNVKPEIGDHLHSFDLDTVNKAFSKARAFKGEFQLKRLQVRRNKVTNSKNYSTSKKSQYQKPSKSKNVNIARNENTKKKNAELRRFISSENNKFSGAIISQSITGSSIASFTCNRAGSETTQQREIYQVVT